MIPANATVDVILPSTPNAMGQFQVRVWAADSADIYTKTYIIHAKNDNDAASQGIRRFCMEYEAASTPAQGVA